MIKFFRNIINYLKPFKRIRFKNLESTNFIILKKAFEKGGKFKINDTVNISKGKEDSILVSKSLNVKGKGKLIINEHLYSELAIVDSIDYLKWRVDVKGSNVNDSHVLFRQKEYSYIKNIDFNCGLENNVSLFRSNHGDSFNKVYGIENMKVDVDFKNQETFVVEASNTPFNKIEITGKGNNFSNVPYWFGISNTHNNQDLLKTSMNHLIVEQLNVKNDSNYYNNKKGMYFTPVLFEGNRIDYTNNNTIGMKSVDDVEAYDVFSSANTVNRSNNNSINNELTSLLKIKKSSNYHSKGDMFISNSKTPVRLYDNGHGSKKIIIEDLEVNVNTLFGHRVSFTYGDLILKNIKLKARNAVGYLVYPRDVKSNILIENVTFDFKESKEVKIGRYDYVSFKAQPTFLKNRGFDKIIIK